MGNGWVKLWRKTFDTWLKNDHAAFVLWFYLISNAAHKDNEFMFNGKVEICRRGQLITGENVLSAELGINRCKVQRILKALKNTHMIERQTNSKFSIITICKYDEYQSSDQQIDQPAISQRSASDHKQELKNLRIKEREEERTAFKKDENIDQQKSGAPRPEKIYFDRSTGKLVNLQLAAKVFEKYPTVDIDLEIENMELWLSENKDKKNYLSFINNWLSKAPESLQKMEENVSAYLDSKLQEIKDRVAAEEIY